MTDADPRARAWRELVLSSLGLVDALERQSQRDAGMPHSYYGALVALYEAPGRELRLGELADRAAMSRSRLSHAVASMERSGWVERGEVAADRRGALARLTPTGVRAVRAIGIRQRETLRHPALSGLDDAEADRLAELLARVRERLAVEEIAPVGGEPEAAHQG